MTTLGTALTPNATKVMMLGSGELGKEVVIELQRLGVEVIAVDRYENAPAQQVAHRAYTISMLDGNALKTLVEKEKPDYIVPEVEAISTATLVELEQAGFNVVPTAKATQLTMNREGIRRLASEELGLPTSPYQFVDNFSDFQSAVEKITEFLQDKLARFKQPIAYYELPVDLSAGAIKISRKVLADWLAKQINEQ